MYANTVNTESLSITKPIALVLFASPRKSGFTAKLTERYIDKIKNDYDIQIIDCYELKISPCMACNYCSKNIGCCINDDFKKIDYLINIASMLIIATPLYYMSFPSPLKAILDRTQVYFNMRFSHNIRPPVKIHKKGVLISSCGSNDENAFDFIIKQLKTAFTILNTTLDETVFLKNTDNLTLKEI